MEGHDDMEESTMKSTARQCAGFARRHSLP